MERGKVRDGFGGRHRGLRGTGLPPSQFLSNYEGTERKCWGHLLKDLNAEEIFVFGNRILRAITVEAAGGEKPFSEILSELAKSVPVEQQSPAAGQVKRWPRLAEIPNPKAETWISLESWVRNISSETLQAIRFFCNALRGVLRYESNAPYSHRYRGTGELITFKLVKEMKAPDPGVFGEAHRGDTVNFCSTLSIYRKRKETLDQQETPPEGSVS